MYVEANSTAVELAKRWTWHNFDFGSAGLAALQKAGSLSSSISVALCADLIIMRLSLSFPSRYAVISGYLLATAFALIYGISSSGRTSDQISYTITMILKVTCRICLFSAILILLVCRYPDQWRFAF